MADEKTLSESEAEFDLFDLNELTNPELTSVYILTCHEFREILVRANRISRGSGGRLATDGRMFWASILFTKICVLGKSVERLLPKPRAREHWDFSAVASLVRNLLEMCLLYSWLCNGKIADVVREGRGILLDLHDYGSRRRLFPDQFSESDTVYEDLVRRFNKNSYLANLDGGRRKNALKGERTPFTQDEVLDEIGADAKNFRFLYRFYSQHTHTGPVSFYRMVDNDHGMGVETRLEKIYTATAVKAASEEVLRIIDEHLAIFPDAETAPPYLTARQIETNVETAQGRRRGKVHKRR